MGAGGYGVLRQEDCMLEDSVRGGGATGSVAAGGATNEVEEAVRGQGLVLQLERR